MEFDKWKRFWYWSQDPSKKLFKYTTEKYDKITVKLDSSSKEFFESLQELIKVEVDIENLVKSNTLGHNMSKYQKLLFDL